MITTARIFIADHVTVLTVALALLAGVLFALHFTAPAVAVTQTIETPAPAGEFDATAVFDTP